MHVQPKPMRGYPWFVRLFFAKQRRSYGKVLEPGLLWGRSKWVFSAVALLYGALNRRSSPLDPALRSLVTVRVSQINHCAFCIDINSATLQKRGVSEDKIQSLSNWRDAQMFSDMERAALDFTEAMTYSDWTVSADQVNALHRFLDDDGVVELTGLVAFQNMSSKFNAALDVPPQGFCPLPLPPAAATAPEPVARRDG